jgi:hypothetical protein
MTEYEGEKGELSATHPAAVVCSEHSCDLCGDETPEAVVKVSARESVLSNASLDGAVEEEWITRADAKCLSREKRTVEGWWEEKWREEMWREEKRVDVRTDYSKRVYQRHCVPKMIKKGE